MQKKIAYHLPLALKEENRTIKDIDVSLWDSMFAHEGAMSHSNMLMYERAFQKMMTLHKTGNLIIILLKMKVKKLCLQHFSLIV
ncbi:MAG: hypothetical protein Kow0068_10440 [Marinilabiliales bacterium]